MAHHPYYLLLCNFGQATKNIIFYPIFINYHAFVVKTGFCLSLTDKNAMIYYIENKQAERRNKRWLKIRIRIKIRKRRRTRKKISSNHPAKAPAKTGLFCLYRK
jgi:hypothetical protein